MGCHFLLQGIFLTQGSNPGLPPCRQMFYRLSHQGSQRIKNNLQNKNKMQHPNGKMDGCLVAQSCLFATSWTVAHQAPLSMGLSRQEYWSGLPFPFSGDLPNPGIEPTSPALQADALLTELHRKPHRMLNVTLFGSRSVIDRIG